ncbi:Glucose facilitated diffusion protein [Frankliniella fusca]|uniref:Glucose facilitated diffusion protein n=1 Tax=Frankliniella fusca TaxID=407009 RepID=A0AAE1HU21_9NEOP|nr:Glucose facilitated diffusion protein [Frankliniella fusca]
MTAVCCAGRCLGCCSCCGSRRARSRRARARAVLPVLLVLLGAGYTAAWGGAWAGWRLAGVALGGALFDALGRRPVIALSVPLQVVAALLHALLVVQEDANAPAVIQHDPGTPHWNQTAELEEAVNGTAAVAGAGATLYGGALLARSACAGAALGVALPATLFYLSELWRGPRRGAVCCAPAIAVVAGRTLAHGLSAAGVLGPRLAALVGLAPGLLGLLLLLLLAPPSPYWLAFRGREVVLSRAIARLRGLRDERLARNEVDDVVETVREQRSSLCAGNSRGPFLALLLVGALPLAGVALLDEKHRPAVLLPLAPAPPDWLVRAAHGGGALLALAVVAALVDRCGRRPLLVAACLALAAAQATLGYFHYFLGTPVPAHAALAWYITLGAVGLAALAEASLSALAWLVLAEVLPMRSKAVIPTVAVLLDMLVQFCLDAVRLGLPLGVDVQEDGRLWLAAWCWAHALWCLLLALIVAALLPETRGFSLAQLHEIFRGPNRQNQQTRL